MKILPSSPPLPHGVRSSFRNRNRNIEIQVCSDSSRTVNNLISDGAAELEACIDDLPGQTRANSLQSSSYGDENYGNVLSGNPGLSSSHLFKGSADWKDGDEGDADDDEDDGDDDDDDDDEDGMQWANSRRPLETAPQSFGYGDSKGFNHAGKMASGKENKVRISRKLAFRLQQHAGPIKPNSGPFSGPLKATTKPNMATSIIPVNLKCKKVLGFDICDPMSPEVTCLGRIKIKEADNKPAHGTTASEPEAVAATPKVEKGKCFDTKNQLCGKRPKGRKKKKVAKCLSRRKRIAPKEAIDRSESFPSWEHGETRREKAASLARSLTDLLEDVRRHKKERMDFVPSVPPPNSLLLMRGCRRRDESYSPSRLNMVDEVTSNVEGCDSHEEVVVEALDEDDSAGDGHMKNFRKKACVRFSLLDLIDMEDADFSTSEIEDTITTHRRSHMKAQASQTFKANEKGDTTQESGTEGSSSDLKKKQSVSEGHSSRMRSPRVALWQRRSFTELTPITTEHMKQKMDHHINR